MCLEFKVFDCHNFCFQRTFPSPQYWRQEASLPPQGERRQHPAASSRREGQSRGDEPMGKGRMFLIRELGAAFVPSFIDNRGRQVVLYNLYYL